MLDDELHRRTFAIRPSKVSNMKKKIYMIFAFGYKSAISMRNPGIKTGIN